MSQGFISNVGDYIILPIPFLTVDYHNCYLRYLVRIKKCKKLVDSESNLSN